MASKDPRPVLRTSLCERLGIEYPILLAGMGSRGRATPAALVAAVSNAGGLGMIGGSGLEPEEIRRVIRHVRTMTDRPIGVDLLLPASLAEAGRTRSEVRAQLAERFPKHVAFVQGLRADFGLPATIVENDVVVSATATADGGDTPDRGDSRSVIERQVDVVLEEDVQVFAAGLGDPSWVVERAHARGITVIGLAGNVRNARRHVAAGVDIVVSQGYEAGGHTGRIGGFALLPQVVDAVAPRPVIAAGGIGDGRGVAAALALGAVGAWIGTAFLVADECEIAEAHKAQIVAGRSEDFEVGRVYTGKTMRSFRNAAVEAWAKSGLDPLPMPYQKVLMDDFNAAAAAAGHLEVHSNPGGQIAGLIRQRRPAAAIMADIVETAIDTLGRLRREVVVEAAMA